MSDDGNPGAFNVFKHCGKIVGILCLFLDVLKGFLPVLLASNLLEYNNLLFSFVVFSPVLGHAIGMFNHFHGGKGIAVSFGVMFGLLPITWIPLVILIVLYILFSTVIKVNPNRKRSIVVYIFFGVISCIALVLRNLIYLAIGCFTISVITIYKHLR